jgi:hypothetical protein
MAIAIFSHGPVSSLLNKIFWTLFVMGLLVTSEWSEIGKTKTQLALVIAGAVHLCVMTFSYDLLPGHRRLTVILLVSVLESFVLGVPIKTLEH